VAAAVLVAGSSSGNGDDDNNKLSFAFKDTGLFDSDGITNNNTITIDGLKDTALDSVETIDCSP
jgi:hypothetical protein